MDNKVICTIFILEYKNSQFGLTGDEIWNKGLQKKTRRECEVRDVEGF
jgi:hypothetical protein